MTQPDCDSDLAMARRLIADAVLGIDGSSSTAVDPRVGEILLRPHQVSAVARLRTMLHSHGGAVLADHVGLGKTYVALAVARHYERVLVVAPAALRDMWTKAALTAACPVTIITTQALSRETPIVGIEADLVIVDEAHHVRSGRTRRYTRLSDLCARADVLLLSATPIQNRRSDLTTELSLFLGSRAQSLGDAQLAELVVRRDADMLTTAPLPTVRGPHQIQLDVEDDVLDELLALPTPLPAADEGLAGALAAYSLVHLWSSSRAALEQSLRRRRARAHALRDSLLAGRYPTRSELGAWTFDDGALQLAFAELVTAPTSSNDIERSIDRVDRYIDATAALLDRLRDSAGADCARARALAAIASVCPGERTVAFTQYAQTALTIGRLLHDRAGVAIVTARGGIIASGPIARADVLAQFDADNRHSRQCGKVDRVELLITTDVMSEGVNLHAASAVVHLDLPWNPARLEQRVGRVRRLGSPHASVDVYTVLPPVAAERLLRIQRRLNDKVATAERIVGAIPLALPGVALAASHSSPAEAEEHLRAEMARWSADVGPVSERSGQSVPAFGSAIGATHAVLALVLVQGRHVLVGAADGELTTDPRVLNDVARMVTGPSRPLTDMDRCDVTIRIQRWLESRRAAVIASLDHGDCGAARTIALGRIERALRRSPRDRRSAVAALARSARGAITQPLSAGAERALLRLTEAELDDDRWLRAVVEFGALHARPARRGGDSPGSPPAVAPGDSIVAVIVVRPGGWRL